MTVAVGTPTATVTGQSSPVRPLRVLVAPHHSEIGGSQLSALELAGALSRRPGVEVSLYLPDGEIVERARSLDVELHLTTVRESAPSPARIREVGHLARRLEVDLVHAYEWAPTIDAAYGAAWRHGIPVLSTILSMDYPYFLPPTIPVIMGTRALYEQAVEERRPAYLLEPPIDTELFDAAAVAPEDVALARAECGADASAVLIVVVGRLAARLKLEGLLTLAAAAGVLAEEAPVQLAIVGDGPARAEVAAAAAEANRVAGREVVRLFGNRSDPRAFYLAADVVVGMGSSALRALALGRPVVVQGEGGFWSVADETSAAHFDQHGWFGVGDGVDALGRCLTELRRVIHATPAHRAASGSFGRAIVERGYSLRAAAEMLEDIYRDVAAASPTARQRWRDATAQSWELAKFRTVRRLQRMHLRSGAEAPS
ncbi:glycosyltransferase family 4 protein [Microbacterium sp. P05]|uniref:glycosyltransferase family 4 protein n=1 Tax=Microbacterium sp. P05 TaxID=3366948 RepID=UPI0037467F88